MYTMHFELSREPFYRERREIFLACDVCEPYIIEHTYGTDRWILHAGGERGRGLIARIHRSKRGVMRLCAGTKIRLIEG